MFRVGVAVVVLGLAGWACVDAAPGSCFGGTRPVISVDFNNWSTGSAYSRAKLKADFDTEATNDHYTGTKIAEGYSGAGLEITYPKGCVGSGCTLWFGVSIPKTTEVYVSFRVKFEGGFTFKKGGKLPGICGGACNTGFKSSNGYDGFSSRIMWRDSGKLVTYAYHPGQRESYGDDYPWDAAVRSGQWVRLSQHIVLNDPGKNNGLLEGFVGNSKVYSRSDMSWRKTSVLKIQDFQFATFFGGDTWEWAPTGAQKAVFDDILVCV